LTQAARAAQHRTLPTGEPGVRLHIAVAGTGPPLALVHGWPLDQRVFAPQITALASHLQVITYDRRGYGRSTGKPDLRADVDDIERIFDALKLESAHLLGMSQGGRIALRFAVRQPGRVRSLVLQAPAVDGFEPSAAEEPIPLREYSNLARQGDLQRVRELWAAHPMLTAGDTDGSVAGLLAPILADYQGLDLYDYTPDDLEYPVNVAAEVVHLDLPVLILTGVLETAARREHSDFLMAHMRQASEVLFPRSGHLSNLTEPDKYNRAVLDFCLRVEAARGRN